MISRGAKVSEVFQYAGGPYNNTAKNPRVRGRDPQGRSYYSFISFEGPDGNDYLLQEVKTRLPGREWKSREAGKIDIGTLAELLHEREQHHGSYEKTHGKHILGSGTRRIRARVRTANHRKKQSLLPITIWNRDRFLLAHTATLT